MMMYGRAPKFSGIITAKLCRALITTWKPAKDSEGTPPARATGGVGYVNMSLYIEVDFGKDSTEEQLHNPIT